MEFRLVDRAVDARATWAVTFGDKYLGTVSEYGNGDYRITDAGPCCQAPRKPYGTQIGAACALMTARRTNPAEQVDESGLMRIERDILTFEAAERSDVERQIEAARLGISPTGYVQIARSLRLNRHAYAYAPSTIERMRARHSAALARTARFRRPASAVLAQAS